MLEFIKADFKRLTQKDLWKHISKTEEMLMLESISI